MEFDTDDVDHGGMGRTRQLRGRASREMRGGGCLRLGFRAGWYCDGKCIRAPLTCIKVAYRALRSHLLFSKSGAPQRVGIPAEVLLGGVQVYMNGREGEYLHKRCTIAPSDR